MLEDIQRYLASLVGHGYVFAGGTFVSVLTGAWALYGPEPNPIPSGFLLWIVPAATVLTASFLSWRELRRTLIASEDRVRELMEARPHATLKAGSADFFVYCDVDNNGAQAGFWAYVTVDGASVEFINRPGYWNFAPRVEQTIPKGGTGRLILAALHKTRRTDELHWEACYYETGASGMSTEELPSFDEGAEPEFKVTVQFLANPALEAPLQKTLHVRGISVKDPEAGASFVCTPREVIR